MTKKKFEKECKECKKKFVTMNVRKTFCSDACKQRCWKHNNKKVFRKRCKECKKSFTSPLEKTKFCSPVCVGTHKNRNGTGKKVKCKQCSKKFKQKHKNHIFCSDYCKGRWGVENSETVKLKCSHCKKKFNRSIYQKSKDAKNVFCSRGCESRFKDKESDEVRVCTHCKKKYKCKKGNPKKICSSKCQAEWQSSFRVGLNSPNYDTSILPDQRVISCGVCGKKVFATPKTFEKKKYCSHKCRVSSMGKTMTSPHKKTVEILRRNRIWNRSEHKVGRYLLDCYLGKGLAIEVQGRYWHGDVRFFEKPKNKMQRKMDEKDRRKKNLLENEGITVLYIWEDDIEDDPEMCEKLILKFKERNGILSNYHSMNYHERGRSVALNRKILTPRFEL